MAAATTPTTRPAPVPTSGPAPSPASPTFGYHPALDGIRALALLTIIAYHDGYTWARGGFISVDTFFVLSGFLITTLLLYEHRRSGTVRLREFWSRRARRLLPALLLVLVFVAAFTYLLALPWDRDRFRDDGIASLFYVANWHFIAEGQSYFDLFAAPSPLRHMWTLAIEEQYYLVWPLIVLAAVRLGRGSLRVIAPLAAVGVAASVVAMQLRYDADDPSEAYFATDARAQALLVGALLAFLLLRWRPTARAALALRWSAVAAAVAMLVGFNRLTGEGAFYYHGGALLFSVLSAVMVAAAMQPGGLTPFLAWRPLAWIGRISYGLYLWHWPVNMWLVPSRVGVDGDALNLLRLAVTFVFATASWVLLERPVLRRPLRPRIALGVFAPAIAAIAAVVMVSGVHATPTPSYLAGTPVSASTAQEAAASRPGGDAAGPVPGGIDAPATLDDGVDAEAPPEFAWGWGDPLLCEPRPDELEEAARAERDEAGLDLPARARSERVLLVGDSTACSLFPGLRAVAAAHDIAADQGSVFGCGVAIDEFTSTRNEAVTPQSSRCRAYLDWAIPRATARARPTTVVWMSVWEKSDLVIDGRVVVAETPEWEREVMARMDATLERFIADGARVALVTGSAPAPNPAQGTETYDRDADDASYVRLNRLLRQFAARHRDHVTLVDLAARLCPDGPPCPEKVDGVHARPDGRHFTPSTAVWASRIILDEMFAPSS